MKFPTAIVISGMVPMATGARSGSGPMELSPQAAATAMAANAKIGLGNRRKVIRMRLFGVSKLLGEVEWSRSHALAFQAARPHVRASSTP